MHNKKAYQGGLEGSSCILFETPPLRARGSGDKPRRNGESANGRQRPTRQETLYLDEIDETAAAIGAVNNYETTIRKGLGTTRPL